MYLLYKYLSMVSNRDSLYLSSYIGFIYIFFQYLLYTRICLTSDKFLQNIRQLIAQNIEKLLLTASHIFKISQVLAGFSDPAGYFLLSLYLYLTLPASPGIPGLLHLTTASSHPESIPSLHIL